jgi:DNA polymerase-3 subunit epsilon
MAGIVAIDFETANEWRGSACQIGMARADDSGRVVETFSSLIHPDPGFDYFRPINMALSGITADDVVDAPLFSGISTRARDFIGDSPILGHNLAFDYSVWNAHVKAGHAPALDIPRLCTLRIARTILHRPTGTNSLDHLAEDLCPGTAFRHHDALADSKMTIGVLFAMLDQIGVTLSEMVSEFALSPSGSRPAVSRFYREGGAGHAPIISALVEDWPQSTALQGKKVCFTGKLERLNRASAKALTARLGGQPVSSVSQKTDVLVVGIPNPGTWRPDANGSSKTIAAGKLCARGVPIEILSETEFFDWIADLVS